MSRQKMKTYGLYSKEVIRHFKKPHNIGKIKKPDGIGKVGNKICGDVMWLYIKVEKDKKGKDRIADAKFQTFGCLPSSEKVVLSNGGWEDISSISKNDVVLNEEGNERLVMKTYKRKYKGILLKIIPFVSPYNSFSITPEHPVLCIKRSWLKHARKYNKKCRWLRIRKGELIRRKPEYVEAKNLEEGDYLVFSYNHYIKDYKVFTKNLMRLIGYYLAEGYVTAKGYVIAFAFNKKKKKNIQRVKFLIKKIIGKEAKERTRKNVTEVYVCSRKLAYLLRCLGGSLAKNKTLTPEILLLPPEKQWEMVLTYLAGDGDSYRRRVGNSLTYRIATVSQSLAIQTQEILARNGIFSSIKKEIHKPSIIEGRRIKGSKLFVISFKLKRNHEFVRKTKSYFLVPIKKIEKVPFEGTVYNFHVEPEPNSYLVKGFAVHNCVAAIATSSMITDLAKGKTLEQAMKITRENVTTPLGGLPKIKLHCSVLATDALNEAIYDYLDKNKLPIPKELKKRHERIIKETEIIEKKYKDYIKMEKEIWGIKGK